MNSFYGEIAALTTALCWAFGSVFFTLSGSRIGSANVNRARLIVALILLTSAHFIINGNLLPLNASPERWAWLGLSGIIGFVVGDGMLFEAFVLIGPRLSMLIMALVPIMSAILGWIFLGESLKAMEVAAIIITIAGITWVVSEKRKENGNTKDKKRLSAGLGLAFGGALGQTIGLALSKRGLEGGFPALSGNVIRVLCAASLILLITIFSNNLKGALKSYKDKKAVMALSAGAFFGPFAGVWLSLISIKYSKLGIATTLMSLTPIFLIPIAHIIFKERITLGAVLGALIAIIGVSILLLV